MNRRDRKKQQKRNARQETLQHEKHLHRADPKTGRGAKPAPESTVEGNATTEVAPPLDEAQKMQQAHDRPEIDDFFRYHDGATWLNDLLLAEPGSNHFIEPLWNAEIPGDLMLNRKTCCEILVAAEVIAAGIGRPSRHLPPRVAEWLIERDALYSHGLVALAATSVRRVGDFSELRQVIDRSGYLPSWLSGVEDLYRRLQIRLPPA
jgi:Domain of unknown function (DUF4259)